MSMSLFKSGDFTCISIIYMHNCGHNIPFKDAAFLWEGRLSYTLCPFKEVWHIILQFLWKRKPLKKKEEGAPERKRSLSQLNTSINQSIWR